jgi:hypothetical protein
VGAGSKPRAVVKVAPVTVGSEARAASAERAASRGRAVARDDLVPGGPRARGAIGVSRVSGVSVAPAVARVSLVGVGSTGRAVVRGRLENGAGSVDPVGPGRGKVPGRGVRDVRAVLGAAARASGGSGIVTTARAAAGSQVSGKGARGTGTGPSRGVGLSVPRMEDALTGRRATGRTGGHEAKSRNVPGTMIRCCRTT